MFMDGAAMIFAAHEEHVIIKKVSGLTPLASAETMLSASWGCPPYRMKFGMAEMVGVETTETKLCGLLFAVRG